MTTPVSLAGLLPPDLPDGREAVAEGRAQGATLEIAPSLYLQEKGAGSERAWRERAAAEGVSCTCINIGLATWPDTREALGCIYEDSLRRGVRPPDRFNILAERRMGLPKALRLAAPQETGPLLMTQQDWWETTHTVPIQPEAADNTIGGPGSHDNAVDAIQAGITHIGVLSQYMWRWPYWEDETGQVMAVLKAAGVLAAHRRAGVCFDSYLEDGYPGVFHDYANYIGWAMLERYVCEDLIGAAYSCSWGGLTSDPVTKAAVTLALHAFRPEHVPAGFIQGDTIGNRADFEANAGVVSTDVLFMKAVDFRYRLGGAPIAVPVTEVERIPTWQEVAQVHAINRRLEEYLPSVAAAIDWPLIEARRDLLVSGGRRFFDAAIGAMTSSGVDVTDPAQVLLVVKRLGAAACEELFGAGAAGRRLPAGQASGDGDRPGAPDDGRTRPPAGIPPQFRRYPPGRPPARAGLHGRARVRQVPPRLSADRGRRPDHRRRREPRSRGHRQRCRRERGRRHRDHHAQRRRQVLRPGPAQGTAGRPPQRGARLHGRRAQRGHRGQRDTRRRPLGPRPARRGSPRHGRGTYRKAGQASRAPARARRRESSHPGRFRQHVHEGPGGRHGRGCGRRPRAGADQPRRRDTRRLRERCAVGAA